MTSRSMEPTGSSTPEKPLARAADEAQQTAANLGSVAGGQIKSQLTSQKGKVATQLGSISDALDDLTGQLRQQQRTGIADYPATAAHQLRGISEQLEQADLDQLLAGAQDMARRRPALFLGAAFAMGIVGARLMKSSPPDHPSAGSESQSNPGMTVRRTASWQSPASGSTTGSIERPYR